MIAVTIITFVLGFFIGRWSKGIKSVQIFSTNKISRMRNRINNKSWVLAKYQALLQQEKDNDHYYKFECESHFVGHGQAEHNKKIYYSRAGKTRRQTEFIKSRIKVVDTNYYLKFIGTIPDDELKALKRNNKLTKLLT